MINAFKEGEEPTEAKLEGEISTTDTEERTVPVNRRERRHKVGYKGAEFKPRNRKSSSKFF